MKPVITFFDAFEADKNFFESHLREQFDLIFVDKGLSADTVDQAAKAQIIAMHVTSPTTAELMAKMPDLKHIACRSTGYDHVDLKYAADHDITVSSVPSYGDQTVAEFAVMLLLSISRRLVPSVEATKAGKDVTPPDLTGHDLGGKTLGVIGTGKIGRKVIGMARGIGMNVVAYDPMPNNDAARDLGYTYVSLDELLGQADAITLHAPALPETEHILNKDTLAKVKSGVIVVNTARGTLIDTPALIDALHSGKVAGAGLDVLEGEEFLQVTPEYALLEANAITDTKYRQVLALDVLAKMPNVVMTNHNAYNSVEALDRIRQTTADNIVAWQSGHAQNLVKLPEKSS